MADRDELRPMLERWVPLRSETPPAWDDVLLRAGGRDGSGEQRSKRRSLLVALLLAALAVAVPTAVALRATVVHFGEAEPAPEAIVESFASMEKGSPLLRPGAIASETRKILEVPNGARSPAVVWVAPTRSGGFCWQLEDPDSGFSAGGCGRRVGGRMQAAVPYAQERRNGRVRGVFAAVSGRVRDRAISRLELRHGDGSSTDIPITWISDPIGVGFFVHSIPPARWSTGKPVELIARAENGRIVKREPIELKIAPR